MNQQQTIDSINVVLKSLGLATSIRINKRHGKINDNSTKTFI